MTVSVYRKSTFDRPISCRKVISRMKKPLRRAIMISDEHSSSVWWCHIRWCVRRWTCRARVYLITLIDLTPAYINQSATAPPQMQIRMRRDVKPDLRDLRRSLRSAVFVIWNTMRDVYRIITVVSLCFQDVLPANLCVAFARFPFYSRGSKAKWELVRYMIVTVASVLQRSTINDHVSPTSCHLNTVAWFGTRMIPVWFQFHGFDRNVQVAWSTFFIFIYAIKNWIYQNYFY